MMILNPRPLPESRDLHKALEAEGLKVTSIPLLAVKAVQPDFSSIARCYDAVLFVSKNAVRYGVERLYEAGVCGADYVAIGASTAGLAEDFLQKLSMITQFQVVSSPRIAESEHILSCQVLADLPKGSSLLIVKGQGGRKKITEIMVKQDIRVDEIDVYQRYCPLQAKALLKVFFSEQKGLLTIIITSGEILENLLMLAPDYMLSEMLLKCRLLVVSRRLLERAQNKGFMFVICSNGAGHEEIIRTLKSLS